MSEVFQLAGILKLVWPVENGKIEDVNAWEKLVHGIFYRELKIDPSERFIIFLTEPYLYSIDLEKLGEILFETFNFAGAGFLSIRDILPLMGMKNFIFGNIGDRVTYFSSSYDGEYVNSVKYNFGGGKLTDYLKRLLRQRYSDIDFRISSIPFLEALKRDYCFVSLDAEKQFEQQSRCYYLKKEVTTPTKKVIIDVERFLVPEALFNFKTVALELDVNSIPEIILSLYDNLDSDIKDECIKNIIITGGSAGFPNLSIRIRNELKKSQSLANTEFKIFIPERPDTYLLEYVQRNIESIMEMENGPVYFITRKKYNDVGPKIMWGVSHDY
ncbi:MAG: hypothetical protein GF364_02970 [Candidatus Lokiarchaeota archaeon]|nr:hypothetical protein [Candidatus Lokiarchaeota archaeon]